MAAETSELGVRSLVESFKALAEQDRRLLGYYDHQFRRWGENRRQLVSHIRALDATRARLQTEITAQEARLSSMQQEHVRNLRELSLKHAAELQAAQQKFSNTKREYDEQLLRLTRERDQSALELRMTQMELTKVTEQNGQLQQRVLAEVKNGEKLSEEMARRLAESQATVEAAEKRLQHRVANFIALEKACTDTQVEQQRRLFAAQQEVQNIRETFLAQELLAKRVTAQLEQTQLSCNTDKTNLSEASRKCAEMKQQLQTQLDTERREMVALLEKGKQQAAEVEQLKYRLQENAKLQAAERAKVENQAAADRQAMIEEKKKLLSQMDSLDRKATKYVNTVTQLNDENAKLRTETQRNRADAEERRKQIKSLLKSMEDLRTQKNALEPQLKTEREQVQSLKEKFEKSEQERLRLVQDETNRKKLIEEWKRILESTNRNWDQCQEDLDQCRQDNQSASRSSSPATILSSSSSSPSPPSSPINISLSAVSAPPSGTISPLTSSGNLSPITTNLGGATPAATASNARMGGASNARMGGASVVNFCRRLSIRLKRK